MNYLHTPPTKIVRKFVNFRFILPKMAASLFGLCLIVLSFTVTILSLPSLKDSIWYNLQIGLVIKEFDFADLGFQIHADLGFLSFSINTMSFNFIVAWFLFLDVILWFSRSIFKYSLHLCYQKWFIMLLIFLEWKFIPCVMSVGSGPNNFIVLPNNKWCGVINCSVLSE